MQFGEGVLAFVQLQNCRMDAAFLVGLYPHKPMFFADCQVNSLVKVFVGSFCLADKEVLFEFLF